MFQSRIIFLESELPLDHKYRFRFDHEEVFLTHDNGEKINGLWFNTPQSSKGTILYFHGNSRNLQHWGRFVNKFLIRGYDVFMIDYRGYGKSDGEVSQDNFYGDAVLAYHHALTKTSKDNVIIYGRSLGSGAASYLATQVDAKMLILVTPFYSTQDVVNLAAPWLITPFEIKNLFPNYKFVPNAKMQTHIFQGDNDNVVPLASAIKLKPLLEEGETFTIIEGANHRNLVIFDKFEAQLDQLLN